MKRRIVQGFSYFVLIFLMTLSLSACGEDFPKDVEKTDTQSNLTEISSGIADSQENNNAVISDTSFETNSVTSDETTDSVISSTSSETDKTSSSSSEKTDTTTESTETSTTSNKTSQTSSLSSETSDTVSSKTSNTVSSGTSSTVNSETSDTVNSDTEPEDKPSQPSNTNITSISPENYYGIRWLSSQPNGKKLVTTYRELVSGIKELNKDISLSAGISVKELGTVWGCFLADYPQYFWIGSNYEYYHINGSVTKITPSYTIKKKDLPKAQEKFDRSVSDLLKGITSSMSQYEIEKTLHDRLILQCSYDDKSVHAHTAYGALVDGVAVCEGIARAFQHLCRSVGIETLFVVGRSNNPNSGNSEGHAWNIVNINGNYYHVDVTWDNTGEPEKDHLHYAWFNLPDTWLTEDHVLLQEGYSYPSCTATKENYFVKVNRRISELTVANVTEKAIKQEDGFLFQGYLTKKTNLTEWFDENASALAEKLGLNGCETQISIVGNEVIIIMKKYS